MTTQQTAIPSLSNYWRIRKSANPAMELVTLLEDMTDVGQELTGDGLESVSWGGTSFTETHNTGAVRPRIKLDARPITGCQAPLPGDRVDVILGEMLHEAGHTRWQSNRVWQLMQGHLGDLGNLASVSKYFHNVCEDFYIDRRYAQQSASAGKYIDAMRRYFNVPGSAQAQVKTLTDPNATDEDRLAGLLQVTMGIALYKQPIPTGLPPEALKTILSVMQVLKQLPGKASPDVRGRMYSEAWGHFKAHPRPTPPEPETPEPTDQATDEQDGDPMPPSPYPSEPSPGEPTPEPPTTTEHPDETEQPEELSDDAVPQEPGEAEPDQTPEPELDDETDKPANEDDAPDGGNDDSEPHPNATEPDKIPALPWDVSEGAENLPDELGAQVAEYIKNHAEDLEAAVKGLLGEGVHHGSFIMQDAETDLDTEAKTRKLAEPYYDRIGRLFNQIRDSNYRNIRGLRTGRINQRRLWRGGMGRDDLFQRRERQNEPGMSLVVLLDQSGSMSSVYQKIVVPIATAIVNGLRSEIECWVVSYTELRSYRDSVTDIRIITRPAWGKALRLGGINNMGGTPSGVGMIAAAELLKLAKCERRMVLHITDGAPGRIGQVDGLTAVEAARTEMERKGILCATLMIGVCYNLEEIRGAYGVLRTCADMDAAPVAIEELLGELLRG